MYEKLKTKIKDAFRKSLHDMLAYPVKPCDLYDLDIFEDYWDDILSEAEKQKLEFHCMDCDKCLVMMAKAMDIHQQTEAIAKTIKDEDLIASAQARYEKLMGERSHSLMPLAASEIRTGIVGEALGLAVSENLVTGALIECNAWVGEDKNKIGKLELWGMQVKGDARHQITLPLDYLEEKLEGLFKTCSVLRFFNLDRRIITVDLKERILSEANSLSLSIIMAIITAFYKQKNHLTYVFSSDIRQDGHLERVGNIVRKIEIAMEHGIHNIILSSENKRDCPVQYLNDPKMNIVFLDTLEEVFSCFGLFVEKQELKCDLEIIASRGGKARALDLHDEKITGGKVSNDWEHILNILKPDEKIKSFLNKIFPEFEDLCLAGNTSAEFSTVFFMGNTEKIKMFLPDSGMSLVVKPGMLDMVDHLKDLGVIVNGKELGFVINENGVIDSIRKVDIRIDGMPDVEPLLAGDNHKFACLSLFTDAFVFYFPPTGRNLHIFHKGKLIGKYLNGKWKETPYSQLVNLLLDISGSIGIGQNALIKAARATVAMAEQGLGGIFAFTPSGADYSNLYENKLTSRLGICFENMTLENMDEQVLINLAKGQGGTVFDATGKLLACHAHFTAGVEWKPGVSARHQLARRFSEMTNSTAFAAGRYGTVTLYHQGKELICI